MPYFNPPKKGFSKIFADKRSESPYDMGKKYSTPYELNGEYATKDIEERTNYDDKSLIGKMFTSNPNVKKLKVPFGGGKTGRIYKAGKAIYDKFKDK
tara:strand:- start:332 stop:622 length:291 start_codon:yes stop_codon:yes gene_type:complete